MDTYTQKDFSLDLSEATILIVDDNKSNTLILENVLQSNGLLKTIALNNSSDFFQVFSECCPDLVLLDIIMPRLDGFEILEWMQSRNYIMSTPVVVITALLDSNSIQRALNLGAKDFLVKPYNKLELIARVKNLLQLRKLYKEMIRNNLMLEEIVREKTAEVKDMQIEIIDRLMHAAEFRDQETGEHTCRISKYVYRICLNIGLSEQDAELISIASKLHDIGKIGIPDQILLKPGRLDVFEMDIMKEHAEKGARILSGSQCSVISVAEQIARSHHERWDGSGYPYGLIGNDIPLPGRITAVADVFDALLSARPYKKEWTFDDAINYISVQSGKHFDPDVVKALLEDIDTIRKIATENP